MIAARVFDDDRTTFVLGEVPEPEPGPTDVLVRVEAAGLAPGVFALLQMGRIPLLPVVLGHEIAGEVVAVGTRADPDLVGARVRVHPSLGCGRCEYCTSDRDMMCSANSMIGHAVFGPDAMPLYSRYHNGGLAQFMIAPESNIDILPPGVGFELGAKVHDFANAIRALKLADLPASSTVAVTAATGAMGTATIALARDFGIARVIAVGRNAYRLAAVRELDPDLVSTVTITEDDAPEAVVGRVRAIEPAGVHAVLDFFPAGTGLAKLFGGIRYGGRIVHMGMNPAPLHIPQIAMSVACVSFVGTRNGTRSDALDAIRILARNPDRYQRLITHRFALADANQARDALLSRDEPIWMSIVQPQLNQTAAN